MQLQERFDTLNAPVFIFSNERKAMKTEAATALTEEIQRRIKRVNDMARHYACQYAETDDAANKTAYLQEVAKARELDGVLTMVCQTLHALEAMIPQPSGKVAA